jgi:hypothetical protein
MNPNLSAWAQVHGQFGFNCTPIAPPGIHVVVHEKSDRRQTWAPHGVDGWYVGPALDSYRCYCTWIWATQYKRITNSLEWFPHSIPMPVADSYTWVQALIRNIFKEVCNPTNGSILPLLATNESAQLQELATIFNTPAEVPAPAQSPTALVPVPAQFVPLPDPISPPPPALLPPILHIPIAHTASASLLRVPEAPHSSLLRVPQGTLAFTGPTSLAVSTALCPHFCAMT